MRTCLRHRLLLTSLAIATIITSSTGQTVYLSQQRASGFFSVVPAPFDGILPGSTVVLTCKARNESSFVPSWYVRPVGDTTSGENIGRLLALNGKFVLNGSTLTISSFSAAFEKEYECSSSTDETGFFAIRIAVVPGRPSDVRSSVKSDTVVSVVWTPPTYYGYHPVTSYVIQYKPASGGSSEWENATGIGNVTASDVTGLDPNVEYLVQVLAVNVVGTGSASSVAIVMTYPRAPVAPANFKALDINRSSSVISFRATFTPVNNSNLPISQGMVKFYEIGFNKVSSPVEVWNVSNNESVVLRNLPKATIYEFAVYSRNGGPYRSSASNNISIRTKATIPSLPLNFRSTGESSTSITLQWTASVDDGGLQVTYEIQYQSPSGKTSIDIASGLQTTVIEGLLPSTTYNINVRAFNDDATGPATTDIQVNTSASVMPPTNASSPVVTPSSGFATIPSTFFLVCTLYFHLV